MEKLWKLKVSISIIHLQSGKGREPRRSAAARIEMDKEHCGLLEAVPVPAAYDLNPVSGSYLPLPFFQARLRKKGPSQGFKMTRNSNPTRAMSDWQTGTIRLQPGASSAPVRR